METVTRPTTKWCPKCNHKIQYEDDKPFCLCPQETPAHSPLPWAVGVRQLGLPDNVDLAIGDATDWVVARAATQEDAELIVKCVNRDPAFQKLVEAGDAIVEWWLREGMHAFRGAPAAMFMLREALDDPGLAREGEE